MKKYFVTALIAIGLMPAIAYASDVYVKDRASKFTVIPGNTYRFNATEPSPSTKPEPSTAATLTKDDALRVFSELVAATSAMDAVGASRRLAPDAVIFLVAATPGGDVELELNPKQYAAHLKAAWKSASSYNYQILDSGAVVSADGKSAMLKAKLVEEAVVEGQPLVGHAVAIVEVVAAPQGPVIKRMVIRGAVDRPEMK